jgi:excinuclease ABC subunit C
MLQQARDEAHRFAVTYNRKRRSLRTVTSALLSIPGIGPSKRRLLLKEFGSIQGVRDATVEQIATLPGFSAASAQRLLDILAARAEGRPVGVASAAAPSETRDAVAPNEAAEVGSTPDEPDASETPPPTTVPIPPTPRTS